MLLKWYDECGMVQPARNRFQLMFCHTPPSQDRFSYVFPPRPLTYLIVFKIEMSPQPKEDAQPM
jgi:hypothetical protein